MAVTKLEQRGHSHLQLLAYELLHATLMTSLPFSFLEMLQLVMVLLTIVAAWSKFHGIYVPLQSRQNTIADAPQNPHLRIFYPKLAKRHTSMSRWNLRRVQKQRAARGMRNVHSIM